MSSELFHSLNPRLRSVDLYDFDFLNVQSLATAVVQLFSTDGPAHNQWFKRDTGILCLIKDNQRKSYFFRIYCMQRRSMIWEHEVYTQIEYKNPRPFLHTFEAEVCNYVIKYFGIKICFYKKKHAFVGLYDCFQFC